MAVLTPKKNSAFELEVFQTIPVSDRFTARNALGPKKAPSTNRPALNLAWLTNAEDAEEEFFQPVEELPAWPERSETASEESPNLIDALFEFRERLLDRIPVLD